MSIEGGGEKTHEGHRVRKGGRREGRLKKSLDISPNEYQKKKKDI